MPMIDDELKQLLAKRLEHLAQAIISSPDSFPSIGYRVWGDDGTVGNDQTGQQWYWLVSLIVSKDKDMIDDMKVQLSPHQK